VLLADEINRAGPKTQSALLEAMEEQQVSVDNETRAAAAALLRHRHPEPQRPARHLPAARKQLDRFLMRITLGYPDRASESLAGRRRPPPGQRPAAAGDAAGRAAGRAAAGAAGACVGRAARLPAGADRRTRSGQWFVDGLSPRAGIAVLRVAKARALMAGRDYVAPDDVQAMLPQAIAHRLVPVSGAGPRTPRAGARHGRGRAHPVTLRQRIHRWWLSRLPLTDSWTLNQRNIYILPTKAGFVFAPRCC
jgi:MoxR-like ATPase